MHPIAPAQGPWEGTSEPRQSHFRWWTSFQRRDKAKVGHGRCLSLAAWPTPRRWPQWHLLFRGWGSEGIPPYWGFSCLVVPGSAGLRVHFCHCPVP